jgi:hypothetical protein
VVLPTDGHVSGSVRRPVTNGRIGNDGRWNLEGTGRLGREVRYFDGKRVTVGEESSEWKVWKKLQAGNFGSSTMSGL